MTANFPTRRQETRTILAISLPLLAAYLAEMGMMITDMIIVGRLGSRELAAVGLTADWFYVLLLIGMGVIAIVGVLVAQSFGEGNYRKIRETAEQGLIVATICSVPVMASIWYLGPALSYARQDPEVIRLIVDYSRPLSLSVIPALWFVALRNYVTALAKASIIMWITAGALLLNVLLNYTLVYGKFGFPALGVVGAALGTSIVNWLMFFVLAWHVYQSPNFAEFRPSLLPRRFDRKIVKEMFALGLPITGAQMLGGAMFTIAAVMVGMLGADILAAQMIVYSVLYVSLSMSVAFGDAARVRAAYGVGIRSVAAIRQSMSIVSVLAVAFLLAATMILWLIPKTLVGVFLDTSDAANANVLAIAVGLSFYAGLFQLVDGIMIVYANGLRGLRDTQSPLWIAILGYWAIGLGLGAWLGFERGLEARGVWWGLIAGGVTATILMYIRLRQRIARTERRLMDTTEVYR